MRVTEVPSPAQASSVEGKVGRISIQLPSGPKADRLRAKNWSGWPASSFAPTRFFAAIAYRRHRKEENFAGGYLFDVPFESNSNSLIIASGEGPSLSSEEMGIGL